MKEGEATLATKLGALKLHLATESAKCVLWRDQSGTAGEVLSKRLKRAKKDVPQPFNVEKFLPRVML